MNVGTVDIYANHSVVFVGSEEWPEVDGLDAPAACDGKHLVVRTRGQFGHTRVSLWYEAMPVVGELVYQGELMVEGYRIWIGDLERINRYFKRLSYVGPQPITVCVDDPFDASRVYVGFGLGEAPVRMPLTAVEGHPLPDVVTSPEHLLAQVDELGLILDDFDSPLARLAGAVKLTSRPRPDVRSYPKFDIDMIAQWLRRLAWDLSLGRAGELCRAIRERITIDQSTEAVFGLSDHDALALASQILGRI